MVKLTRMEVESIGCTKLRGYPCYLDGNKLYFMAEVKDKKGKLSQAKCRMDCSISRKKWDLVSNDQWPVEPQPWDGNLSWEVYAYALWLLFMHELKVTSGKDAVFQIDRKANQNWERVSWRDCSYVDFLDIYKRKATPNDPDTIIQKSGVEGDWTDLYRTVTQEAKERAAEQTRKIRQLRNVDFKPMREIGEEETAFLLGLFNFDGDKKALCTALKSSWNADLSDKDVKVDTLITKKFTLPKPLEEYIP